MTWTLARKKDTEFRRPPRRPHSSSETRSQRTSRTRLDLVNIAYCIWERSIASHCSFLLVSTRHVVLVCDGVVTKEPEVHRRTLFSKQQSSSQKNKTKRSSTTLKNARDCNHEKYCPPLVKRGSTLNECPSILFWAFCTVNKPNFSLTCYIPGPPYTALPHLQKTRVPYFEVFTSLQLLQVQGKTKV